VSPDPVRDEAERLVAAAIAAVSVAARGLSGGAGRPSFATGTPECCICPVCRVIAAMREPSPELSERLATGAGDLAAAVTSLLRAFARPDAEADRKPDEGDEYWESLRRHARPSAGEDHDPWHAATTADASSNHTGAPSHAASTPPKPSPSKPSPSMPTPPTPTPPTPTPPKPMAKKAVAKKAVAKKAVKKTALEQGDQ
jgi:hypothetical protein